MTIEPITAPLRMDEHGIIRVAGTRVPIERLLFAFNQGASAEEIAMQFPAVALADVYAVIAYYLRHREELDEYARVQQAAEDTALDRMTERDDTRHIRERLLARARDRGLR